MPITCIIQGINKFIDRLTRISIIIIGVNDIELALKVAQRYWWNRITPTRERWDDAHVRHGR